MSNVVSLSNGSAINPQADLVEMLEALLDDVRAGSVVAVAYANVRSDGSTGTAYCEGVHGMQLIAASNILAHRITGDFTG